jgi:hypothetical protein
VRRQCAVAAAVAAVLVATAGCAGLDWTPGSPTSEPGRPDASETTVNAAAAPFAPPLDGSGLLAAHAAALADAGSFTVSTTRNRGDPGGGEHRRVVRADLDTGAVYRTLRVGNRTRRAYSYGNGTGYMSRQTTGSRPTYAAANGSLSAERWVRGPVADAVAMFEFAYAGTERVDGRLRHVYEAVALDTAADRFDRRSDLVVSSASATLRVRPDGLVAFVRYEYAVDSSVGAEREAYTARYADLGATSLAAPAWLEDARAATRSE